MLRFVVSLRHMRASFFACFVLVTACRHNKGSEPTLLSSAEPAPWATVSLTVAGSEADDDKRKSCVEEAHTAGIQLAGGAPVAGTLYFLDHDDYLEIPGAPNTVFTAMGSNAECKLALGKLTKIETLVPMSKADPSGCKPTGSVEGSDSGFFHPGNYDAAVVEAQFKVRSQGGTVFIMDTSRQEATRIIVNGRGFACAPH